MKNVWFDVFFLCNDVWNLLTISEQKPFQSKCYNICLLLQFIYIYASKVTDTAYIQEILNLFYHMLYQTIHGQICLIYLCMRIKLMTHDAFLYCLSNRNDYKYDIYKTKKEFFKVNSIHNLFYIH